MSNTYSLFGNTVSSTFQYLVQVRSGNEYYDGFGNPLNIGAGIQGNTGPQGNTGSQGETGPQGFTGNQGVTGPQGFTGVQGETGSQGAVVTMVQTIVQWTYGGLTSSGVSSSNFYSTENSFSDNTEFDFSFFDINNVDYSDWFGQLNTFVLNNNISYLQIYDSITSSNTGLYKITNVIADVDNYKIIVESPSLVSNGTFSLNETYNVTWVANGSIGSQGSTGVQGFTGPQGFTGNQGETGPQGFTGPQGSTGAQGFTGNQGESGPQGFQGIQGPGGVLSVLNESFGPTTSYTVIHNFGFYPVVQIINDSFQEIIPVSITHNTVYDYTVIFQTNTSGTIITGVGGYGQTGVQGNTGVQGFTGPQGFTGNQGETGPQGHTGVQGETGPQGNTGNQGETGPQGFTGNQGSTGPQGFTGVQGETGPQGATGASLNYRGDWIFFNDYYTNDYVNYNGLLYINYVAQVGINLPPPPDEVPAAWVQLTLKGDQGVTGPQGFTGIQGSTGFQGVTGPQGFTGIQGSTGFQGVTGPQGYTGPQGPTGIDGIVVTAVQSLVEWKYKSGGSLGTTTQSFVSNNDSISSVTDLNFSKYNYNGVDYSGWFNELNTFVTSGFSTYLQLFQVGTPSNIGLFKVGTVSSGADSFTVSFTNIIVSSGTLVDSSLYSFTWVANGKEGPQGPTGFGTGGTGSSSLPFFYQSAAPTASSLTAGSRWFHSDTGVEYVYINDGDSTQWVQPTSTIAGSLNHYTWGVTTDTYNVTLSSQYGPEYFGVSSSVTSYVYLPTNVGLGKSITVKDESGNASINNIYIVAFSGESIDNSTQSQINTDYGSKTLLRRNNNWWLI